jgi:hypothetical protein
MTQVGLSTSVEVQAQLVRVSMETQLDEETKEEVPYEVAMPWTCTV